MHYLNKVELKELLKVLVQVLYKLKFYYNNIKSLKG